MAVASLAVSNYIDLQKPFSLLQLPHDDDQQKNTLTNLIYFVTYKLLFDSFRLLLKRAGYKNKVFIPVTCLLENAAKCEKKTVIASSLVGQPCQM